MTVRPAPVRVEVAPDGTLRLLAYVSGALREQPGARSLVVTLVEAGDGVGAVSCALCPAWLADLAVDAQGRCHAVGVDGSFWSEDDTGWTRQSSGAPSLHAVARVGEVLLACGDGGALVRYQHGTVQRFPTPWVESLFGIAGLDTERAVAVGQYGQVVVFDGESWSSAVGPRSEHYLHVGGHAGAAWIAGATGGSGSRGVLRVLGAEDGPRLPEGCGDVRGVAWSRRWFLSLRIDGESSLWGEETGPARGGLLRCPGGADVGNLVAGTRDGELWGVAGDAVCRLVGGRDAGRWPVADLLDGVERVPMRARTANRRVAVPSTPPSEFEYRGRTFRPRPVGHAVEYGMIADRYIFDLGERGRFLAGRVAVFPMFTAGLSLAQAGWALGEPAAEVRGYWRAAVDAELSVTRSRGSVEVFEILMIVLLVGDDDERRRLLAAELGSGDAWSALSSAWQAVIVGQWDRARTSASAARTHGDTFDFKRGRDNIHTLADLVGAFADRDEKALDNAWRRRERWSRSGQKASQAATWAEGVLDVPRIVLGHLCELTSWHTPPATPYAPSELRPEQPARDVPT